MRHRPKAARTGRPARAGQFGLGDGPASSPAGRVVPGATPTLKLQPAP